MALLHGRAGRLNTKNGGFRPGQYDWKSDELVLTGLSANATGGFFHQILRGALSGPDDSRAAPSGGRAAATPCAKFKEAGRFWFSSDAPMIHTSALGRIR